MKFKPYNFRIILISKRFNLLYSCIFFILIILLLRLTYLQLIDANKLIHESNIRSLRVQHISSTRGIITDRMGQLLAISIPVDSVWIDPYKINRNGGISSDICLWTALSKILNISLDKLSSLVNNHATERFIYLARQIDSSVSQHINQLKLPGVYLQQESKRYYPAGCVTAHLIGVTDIDNQGIEGIEKSFNTWLSGQPTTKVIRKDGFGRTIEETTVEDGQVSQNIVLSIDERLQYLAYHELNNAIHINKAESGSIVLIDIHTGEILAMTNSPSYNPNNLSITNKSVMRNRAITDAFEPGSTVKPIVIMAALKQNIITPRTIVNTSPYMIDGHQVRDVICYDKLTIKEILQKSSNVGVSKLALSMPATTLVQTYLNFGMGKATNIGLIGESSGVYPYDKYWSDIERATFSYGYGLMITPLQLAKVYATIGGMGMSKPLSIIRVNSPLKLGDQVFPKSLVRTVLDMMESVSLPGGSSYQETIKGYRVAVKTGTIKTVGPHGKYINKYIACAAGVAPISNPRFALAVVINDPKNGHYYGNMVSAPVFRKVMSNTLKIMNIDPDFLK